MITLVDSKLQSKNLFKRNDTSTQPQPSAKTPSFRGGVMDVVTAGLQLCEQNPMLNVSVLDIATCIGPRTIVDTKTNAHAGLETLRRESSGLVFNCLLPSGFVYLVAQGLKHFALPEQYRHLGMASSWANEDAIEALSKHFKNKGDKAESVNSYVKSVLSNLEGFTGSEGKNWTPYSDSKKFNNVCKSLSDAILSENISSKEKMTVLKEAFNSLTEDVKAVQTIRFKGQDKAYGSKLGDLLRDTLDMGRKFSDKAVISNIDDFTKSAIKFVNHKSIIGLLVVIPICMSLQYLNRLLTRKQSGVQGAPIYKDFAQDATKDGKSFGAKEKKVPGSKDNLFLHKLLGAAVIAGVAITSMGCKMPTRKMLQFSGKFPTSDQARFIAGATFMSRIFAAEDNNEVRESTVRDAVGFAGLYFLGDYAGKIAANVIEHFNPAIKLFNRKQLPDANAGVLTKLKHWFKDYDLKTFEEMASPKFRNARAVCQIASLGASLAILGLLIPIWNRRTTEKNRAKELAALKEMEALKDTVQSDRAQLKQSTILYVIDKLTSPNKTFGNFEQMTFKGKAQA